MTDFLIDYATFLVRWLHVIAAIAWIGASFYFVWLDNHLEPTDTPDDGLAGQLWAIHGGGFYNNRKFRGAPPEAPKHLHWFKWEAYWTWISGFSLLVLVYYTHPAEYLTAANGPLSSAAAIAVSIGFLLAAWLVYDALCRSPLGSRGLPLTIVGVAVIVIWHWAMLHLFGNRGAYIQIGAMLGTCMAANVLMVIIPGQKRMVRALLAGAPPDLAAGLRGKQRSVHNNYLTLPVVALMLSSHAPATYNNSRSWLILAAIVVGGMLVRHFVNVRHRGTLNWWLPAAVGAIIVAVGVYLAPDDTPAAPRGQAASFADVQPIIRQRCAGCHATAPTQPGISTAPAGVLLDEPARIVSLARRINEQAVVLKAMPPGNVTGITEKERATIGAWFASGAPGP